jgi:hypothetical protein
LFRDYKMLQKIGLLRKHITQCHKSIHVTLEVKTFFDTLHLRRAPVQNLALKD